ncbi:MAG: CotH kinase family protein [Bacteroidales bacterium]|nr:CotH kinase family protein [Bacteroidales bacterium]
MKKHITTFFALILSLSLWAQTDFSNLRLNEISGENTALFVEIFNSGTDPIDLEGVRLQRNEGPSYSTSLTTGTEWVGQAGDSIPAGAYRIILFRNGRSDGNNSGPDAPSQLQNSPAWPGMSWTVTGGLSNQQTLKIALVDPAGEPIDVFIRGDVPLPGWGTPNASRPGNVNSGAYGNIRPGYSRMDDGSWAWAAVTPGTTNGPRLHNIVSPGYLTEIPGAPCFQNLFLIGTFNDWTWSSAVTMTPSNNGCTFTTTIFFEAGTQFKFAPSRAWDGREFRGIGSDVPDNDEEHVFNGFQQSGNMRVTAAGYYRIRVDVRDSIISIRRTTPADYTVIRLNEVSGVGSDSELFYELINLGNYPINLEGFRIYYNTNSDRGGSFPPNDNRLTWVGCADQIILPGQLFTLMGRHNPCSFTTGLTAQRILIIKLVDPNGNEIDRLTRARDDGIYDIRNRSFSRIPDGTGPFFFTTPTPNAFNGTSTAGLTRVPQIPYLPQPPALHPHPVFDISALPTITIEVSVDEWNRSLRYFDMNPHHLERVRGNFVFYKDGIETRLPHEIGFRIRGNTSRRRPEISHGGVHNPDNPVWQNAHFSINFASANSNQRFHGLRRLIMKWHKDDAMFAREIYSFDLFHRFGVWTAPRASYARLYIKVGDGPPAYFGIYAMIEQVDETFLSERRGIGRFETDNGNLWKCQPVGGPADLTLNNARQRMGVRDVRLDPSQSRYYTYDLKTNRGNIATAREEFYNWVRNLNTLTGDAFKTWITTYFDVDLFLRAYAVNVVLGQWDGHWGNGNNFYLYFESHTGRVFYIPWDYDNVLGTGLNNFFDPGTENVLRWGGGNRPLIDKILAIEEFREQYLIYLNQLIHPDNDLFHVDRSIPRIEAWHDMIRNYIRPETVENNESAHRLIDRPATWGNFHHYRILERGPNNFFEVRAANIPFREAPPFDPPSTDIVVVETEDSQPIILYPNPVIDGILFIELPAGTNNQIVKVFNLSGRLVLAQAATYPITEIDISHLANGMYIVRIGNASVRIIKQ